MENLDLSLIANVVQQDKKEKRQKRGPNKWMPMRRTVDPELQKRIRQAAGLNDEEKTPEEGSSKKKAKKPSSTKKRKSPSAAKKRIQVQDDSSEDEEMDSQKDGASDSENSSTNQRKSQNQKRYVPG